MRQVRDVIRLKSAGMPTREIARRVGAAPSTVRSTIRRFEAAVAGRCPTASLMVTMRQSHAAGDKLFVDYAGDGVPVVIDWAHRRAAHRADFRRGARRIELHLRAGDLDAGARRLNRRPRRRLRGDRRRAGAAGMRHRMPPPVVSDEVAASVLPRAGAV
jgi:hypothetical protein